MPVSSELGNVASQVAFIAQDCMIISEGHFPFYQGSFLFNLDGNIPPSLLVLSRWPLERADRAELCWLITAQFLAQLLPAPLMDTVCPVSSRAGNLCIWGGWSVSWFGCRSPWPSGGCAVLDSLFLYNDFCVGFPCETLGFKVCECL